MVLWVVAAALPVVWAAIPWQGEPSGRNGKEMATALRQGYAILDVGPNSASSHVLSMQNRSLNCSQGPQEHVNVLASSDGIHWALPPCWRFGESVGHPQALVGLAAEMSQVSRWVVRAAAVHAPKTEEWLPRALQEMDGRSELLRAFAYRSEVDEVEPQKLLPTVPSKEAFRMMKRSYEKIGSGTPYDLWAPDCPIFQLVDFHVKGRGRCQVLGTLDLVSWQVLADGELTGEPSALPCLQPEMQVRYLLVKAPDDAIVTPQGVCAGLIPPAAVRWSHSVPHQDASWVTLLVESSSGLLIKPNRLDSWQKVSFARPGHLLVLVGAALALASEGHYPAPCHAVQVPSSFRLSWAWISPAHSCFYNPTHQMHLSQCGMVWRPNFTAPADCRDGNLLGGGMRGLLKRRSSLLPLELASAH